MVSVTGYSQTGADDAFRYGFVGLDEYSGTDDAKLTSAMSYASSQTHPPAIRLAGRSHTFSTQRTPYTGFRLVGSNLGISNSELADANTQTKVTLTTNGTWLYVNGSDTFDALVQGIVFIGSSSTTFLGCDGSATWHCSHLRDVSFHAFKTVLGDQSQKLRMTASLIDGWFQVQGTYNGGIHIGGSDNALWMNGALIDSDPAYATAGGVNGQYHFWFDGLDNTHVGRLYITSEAQWCGVRVTGTAYNASPPGNLGMVYIDNPTIEGSSAAAPGNGAMVRVEGGIVRIYGGYIGRAMGSPSGMGHPTTDAGTIHVTGGQLVVDGTIFDRATGQAESLPFVYVNGSSYVRVSNTLAATKGGTWSGRPQVTNVTAGGGTVNTDNSVQLNSI